MSAQIIHLPVPHLNLNTARMVVTQANMDGEDGLRDACEYLRRHGDWLDREKARMLLAVLDEEAADHKKDVAERQLMVRDTACSIVALFAIAVLTIWIGHGLGLPTGGEQLIGVVR